MPDRSLIISPARSEIRPDAERDSNEVKLYAYLNAQLESKKPHPYVALVTDVRTSASSSMCQISASVDSCRSRRSRTTSSPSIRAQQLHGRRSRRVIKLGDDVTVQIYRIDSYKKQVDFALVESWDEKPRESPVPRPQKTAASTLSRRSAPRTGDKRPARQKHAKRHSR